MWLCQTAMGCCSSLCGDRSDGQEGTVGERTHLLVDPVRSEPVPPRPAGRTAQPPRKPDEQSALNRILLDTANNVIDVGALGSHALEPHEYSERIKHYQSRLAGVSGGGGAGGGGLPAGCIGGGGVSSSSSRTTPIPQPRLLCDVSHAEKAALMAQEPVAPHDKQLIGTVLRKAAAAMSKLKVEHREDLVVPFRIP